MKKVSLTLIKFYRNYLSGLKMPCCIYYPTCSEYALLAFQKYNVFKALYLTIFRIIRCNPFSKGGYDPVP